MGAGGVSGNPDDRECTGVKDTDYKIFHSFPNKNNTGITQNNVICTVPSQTCVENSDCDTPGETCVSNLCQ